jgi:hypothetical protein
MGRVWKTISPCDVAEYKEDATRHEVQVPGEDRGQANLRGQAHSQVTQGTVSRDFGSPFDQSIYW